MSPALRVKCVDAWKTPGPDECLFLLDAPHAHGRSNDAPGEYLLLTASQVEAVIGELLKAVGNIRLSAPECSRRQPAPLRMARGARPAARLPDLLPDLKPAIL